MLSYFLRTVPVWRIFWLYVVIVVLLISALMGYLLIIADTTDIAKTRMYAQTARIVLAGLLVVYLYQLLEGIRAAASYNRHPSLWSYLAMAITGLLIPVVGHFAYDPWHYKHMVLNGISSIPPSEELLAEVDTVQSSLPRKLSKTMAIESAVLDKRDLVFEVNAKGRLGDAGAPIAESKLWTMLTKDNQYCDELKPVFEQGLWTAVYEVRYDDSTFFARLTPEQCAENYEHEYLRVKKRF
ncbi:hypothetical protein [Cognatishimia activa]|uniref:hypothetical protein n=1 Tax=Cognatishimia activa TaxID=1715691 RepID=UPI002232B198|nr:hypothetical protein [Cognatishimia activa]UZD91399.1 hypothetical protein M0D42_01920 [Cognatishimia activa]